MSKRHLSQGHTMLLELTQEKVLVNAQCRVQYDKYFPSFSYFATYFTRP